ncbi:hypothetical protein Tco_1460395 [Tanacetum coccineum]
MLLIFSQRLLILADLTFWLLALDYLISKDVFVRVMIDEIVDQHNMVACLEKSEGNDDFHEIVDFLTASIIHYALTQIHATIDGKTIVISESSVMSDLHFNDEDGITCLTNTAIFENLALIGYESDSDKLTFQKALFSPQWKYLIHTILHCLSSKSTSWNEFSTNIASAVICLATGQKFNFSKLIFDEQIPVIELSSPQNTQSPRQALQKDTQLPQTSVPIPNVAYKVVFKERGDRVVRATTTAASLDAAQASGDRPRCQESMRGAIAQTRYERASKNSYDSPLLGFNTPRSDEERKEQQDLTYFIPPTPHDLPLSEGDTPRSDEGRPNINELMAICTNLSNRVLALEQAKTAQDLVINKLQNKVKRLEKALREIL